MLRFALLIVTALLLGCGEEHGPVKSDAGEDQTVTVGETVNLMGVGLSDSYNDLSFKWSIEGNKNLEIKNSHLKHASFIAKDENIYKNITLTLTVTDQNGNSDKDSVNIFILPKLENLKFIADEKNKRLFYPIADTSNQSITIDLHRNLAINSSLRITEIQGERSPLQTINDVNPGDKLDAFVTINTQETLEEQWTIVFTQVPIIRIQADRKIKDTPKIDSKFQLLDHNGLVESRMGVEIRGQSSQAYPKKSYDIELWKERSKTKSDNQENKISLLSMRNDGDWILDAMFVDLSRMRNRVAMDLWMDVGRKPQWTNMQDQLKSQIGINGEYVEVFVNDDYQGLYILSEQIDRKQLKVKSHSRGHPKGIVYKADNWGDTGTGLATIFEADLSAPIMNDLHWVGWNQKYPKETDLAHWEPLYKLYDLVKNRDNEEFISDIPNLVLLDNLIDYTLFLNLVGGEDNRGKNTYFYAYDISSSDLDDNKLIYTFWDMDGTWGRNWHSGMSPNDHWLSNNLLDRVADSNPNLYRTRLKQRWQELRSNQFDVALIMERFYNYYYHLDNSGALAREANRWDTELSDLKSTTINLAAELDYIENWLIDRTEWLDRYISDHF